MELVLEIQDLVDGLGLLSMTISIISGFEQTTTNNRMELSATINSIESIKEH